MATVKTEMNNGLALDPCEPYLPVLVETFPHGQDAAGDAAAEPQTGRGDSEKKIPTMKTDQSAAHGLHR